MQSLNYKVYDFRNNVLESGVFNSTIISEQENFADSLKAKHNDAYYVVFFFGKSEHLGNHFAY